jgi:peptide chain release factor subunit 1
VSSITAEDVRNLVAFRGTEAPVTTCYLDVDGRHLASHRELLQAFDLLVRRAGLNGHTHPSVVEDVARMSRHVRGLKRTRARSVAMFSCSAQGLWTVHDLPRPVTSRLAVQDTACVRQLEEILDHSMRLALLLTDRQSARLVVHQLGELVEDRKIVDPLPRQGDDDRGDLVKTRLGRQRQQHARQHTRRAAQATFDLLRSRGFDSIVIAAPTPDVLTDLEQALHPYVRARVTGRVQLPVALTDEQLLGVAADAEAEVERRSASALVARLRDASAAAPPRAVLGLDETLRALRAKRVERMVVSGSFSTEGWRCDGCGALATIGRRCPACRDEMRHLSDVVEEAVHEALCQHRSLTVLAENADLDVLGRIGALLRF